MTYSIAFVLLKSFVITRPLLGVARYAREDEVANRKLATPGLGDNVVQGQKANTPAWPGLAVYGAAAVMAKRTMPEDQVADRVVVF
jgi:hypothetical protein